MLFYKGNITSPSAETNFDGTNSKTHPLCGSLYKGYGITYLAMFSIRILQRTHLYCSKWSFVYLLSTKVREITIKNHSKKAFLQENEMDSGILLLNGSNAGINFLNAGIRI